MQLLISDANILIDLEEGQFIELMFQLPFCFSIPDILFVEELEEEHQRLLELGLQLGELSSKTMMHAMELVQRYNKPSRNKLVPQDPKDEPASELLKRIAAVKTALQMQNKSAGQRT